MGPFLTPQTEQNEVLLGKLVELNWYYLIVYLNLTADSNSFVRQSNRRMAKSSEISTDVITLQYIVLHSLNYSE